VAFTLTQIDGFIANIEAAYNAAISGKSYTINTGGTSRSVTRNDADKLLTQLQYWQGEREKVVNGGTGIPTKFITHINI